MVVGLMVIVSQIASCFWSIGTGVQLKSNNLFSHWI